MDAASTRERGRDAYERRAWSEAYALLSEVDRDTPLGPEDLERLATAAFLSGRNDESVDLWARAHHALLNGGDVARAARCAFWIAFSMLHTGNRARAGGWLSRARTLLGEENEGCVEQGYLLLPEAMRHVASGDAASAYETFCRAAEIGERCGDPDLAAFARHGRGRTLIRLGRVAEGVALLDEAMAAVEAGEVSPLVAGDVYCSVIEGCLEIFDLGRAQEWTAALTRWCDAQPDLTPFTGQCLVRRAEILQLHGAWPDAASTVQRACERFLRGPDQPATGSAFYRKAELLRLRGVFAEAEEAYRQASLWGRRPQPGLALLRLAQGEVEIADTAIRHALEEAREAHTRCTLLPAFIEIMLATGDQAAARAGADELAGIAAGSGAPFLHAVAGDARGAVALAAGDADSAFPALRESWVAWQEIDAPYEAARTRVLIGLASRALGDEETAEMEFEAARSVFQQLGAGPDLAHARRISHRQPSRAAGGLTRRELQVLRLVAAGKTNRAIADTLFISEKTVARHMSNILSKLGLSTRTEATAYAYRHDLV